MTDDPGLPAPTPRQATYRYFINLEPDSGTFRGAGAITLYNTGHDSLSEVSFFLLPNAYRDTKSKWSETEDLEAPARLDVTMLKLFEREIPFTNADSMVMKVRLEKPIPPGDSALFLVEWHGVISEGSAGFAPSRDETSAQWFGVWPRIIPQSLASKGLKAPHAFLGDPSDWEVTLQIPLDWTPAAPGIVEKKRDKRRVTWEIKQPHRVDLGIFTGKDYVSLSREVKLPDGTKVTLSVCNAPDHPFSRIDWLDRAADILVYYDVMFGPPPGDIAFFEGNFMGGVATDGSILLSRFFFLRDRGVLKMTESILAHEISHQWWGVKAQADEAGDTWLNESFATWSAWAYMVDTYGPHPGAYPMSDALWFLTDLDDWDIYGLMYTLVATDRQDEPIWTPDSASDFEAMEAVIKYYKGAQVLWLLSDRVGIDRWKSFLKEWGGEWRLLETGDFRRATRKRFPELEPAFLTGWLETNGTCDIALSDLESKPDSAATGGYRSSVRLTNRRELAEPVTLAWLGEKETLMTRSPRVSSGRDTVAYATTSFPVKRVVADPQYHLPDPWRLDNRTPREWRADFLLDWPDQERRQVYFIPYVDYDNYNGLKAALTIAGGYLWDMQPTLPIDGDMNFLASARYGFKSHKIGYSLYFGSPFWHGQPVLRADLHAEENSGLAFEEATVTFRAGRGYYPGLSRQAGFRVDLSVGYLREDLRELDGLDPRVWTPSKGEYGVARIALTHRGPGGLAALTVEGDLAGRIYDGNLHGNRLHGELILRYESDWFFGGTRLFAGTSDGEMPSWRRYFWSGGQRLLPATWLLVGQTGWFSPTGNLHLPGDGNLLGYQKSLPASSSLTAVNLEAGFDFGGPKLLGMKGPSIRLGFFADAGWPGDSLSRVSLRQTYGDAGFSLALGPISGYFPLWVGRPLDGEKSWAWRWMISVGGYF